MAKISKRMQAIRAKLTPGKFHPIEEAFELLKELPGAKFRESVDVAVNLGVDPRKSDQVVRSATVLPHGTGKTVRVAVFAQGANADAAHAAGADVVGFEDLAESVKAGNLDFDVVIAAGCHADSGPARQNSRPARLDAQPQGRYRDTRRGGAIRNAKAGQVRYRTDKAGIIHCTIGKLDFASDQLRENLQALLHDLQKIKPATSKGVYIRRVTVSTTMGPGLAVDQTTLSF